MKLSAFGDLRTEPAARQTNMKQGCEMRNNDANPLAALIRHDREALLLNWRRQVRELPSARQLDIPTLNDHIPRLLDELAVAFQSQSDQTIPEALSLDTKASLPPALVWLVPGKLNE